MIEKKGVIQRPTALVLIVLMVLIAIPSLASAIPVDVRVDISRFIQMENPDTLLPDLPPPGHDIPPPWENQGDYYAEVLIGDEDHEEWQRSGTTYDDSDITPNWVFINQVDTDDYPPDGLIPVFIRIFDEDPLEDDVMDLDIDDDRTGLELAFGPTTGTWTGDTTIGYSRGDGDTEHVGGELDLDGTQGGQQGIILFGIAAGISGDTDEDGIPDSIEINGIYDVEGNLHTDMAALGCDPCRKTIAVEVDYMSGAADGHTHQPMAAAITEAVTMFNDAPVDAVAPDSCPYAGFPDSPRGINLVVDIDDPLPEQATFACSEFDEPFKTAHFDAERRPYFHYNFWIHNLAAGDTSSGYACGGGRGDFLVSLGSWCEVVDPPNCPVATQNGNQRDQAGTFVHELGHTLDLGHGGGDSINRKPNYLSIMSYTWQTIGIIDSATGISRLDFSHDALPTLDELSLSEPDGIGDGTLFTYWRDPNQNWRGGVGNGPLDWTWDDFDGDGVTDNDAGVIVDINGDSICISSGTDTTLESTPAGDDTICPGMIQCICDGPDRICDTTAQITDKQVRNPGDLQPSLLGGYDDWSNIDYGEAAGPGGGVSIEPHSEITYEEALIIKTFWRQFLMPDLAVEKDVDQADALPGDTLTYSVTVINEGNIPMTAIQLTDTFPDGTVETRLLGELAAGTSATETFTFEIPFPTADATILTNTVQVTGMDLQGNPDGDLSNNVAAVSTTIHTPVLSLAKTAATSVNPGETIIYTLTFENTGSASADDVVITDILPVNVYYSTALDTGTGPQPDTVTSNPDGTTTLTWTVDELGAGSGTQTITFTARPSLLFLTGSSVSNNALLDFSDKNGNHYPALATTAPTTITEVIPGKTPLSLGYYRNHPDVRTDEILAMIQATDTRFDGADKSLPDGKLSAAEVTAILTPGGNQPKILLMQLLATDFNLATRQITAGTEIESTTATMLGLTNVRDAVLYAMDTLQLPVTKANRERYSDATKVLDQINNGMIVVY